MIRGTTSCGSFSGGSFSGGTRFGGSFSGGTLSGGTLAGSTVFGVGASPSGVGFEPVVAPAQGAEVVDAGAAAMAVGDDVVEIAVG